MKRWIHASYKYESELLNIISTKFGCSTPQTGCTFIMPDGEFLNVYPTLDTHEDLCEWVEDNTEYELEYSDEEYFIREFGLIRLRNDPRIMVIELPSSRPSASQFSSLEEWLMFCEERHPNGAALYLNVCDGADADVEYEFGTDYFAEDIVKICQRYYGTGKLYASTALQK